MLLVCQAQLNSVFPYFTVILLSAEVSGDSWDVGRATCRSIEFWVKVRGQMRFQTTVSAATMPFRTATL